MNKVENIKKITEDEIDEILHKKLTLIDKDELHKEKIPESLFLVLEEDHLEDVDDKITPKDLEKLLLRCLEKDPSKRFARVADLSNALRKVARSL